MTTHRAVDCGARRSGTGARGHLLSVDLTLGAISFLRGISGMIAALKINLKDVYRWS